MTLFCNGERERSRSVPVPGHSNERSLAIG